MFAPKPAHRLIARQAIEPRWKGHGLSQARHTSQHIKPHVLQRIFGSLPVYQQLAKVITQTPIVALDEFRERRLVTGLSTNEQHLLVQSIVLLAHPGVTLERV